MISSGSCVCAELIIKLSALSSLLFFVLTLKARLILVADLKLELIWNVESSPLKAHTAIPKVFNGFFSKLRTFMMLICLRNYTLYRKRRHRQRWKATREDEISKWEWGWRRLLVLINNVWPSHPIRHRVQNRRLQRRSERGLCRWRFTDLADARFLFSRRWICTCR